MEDIKILWDQIDTAKIAFFKEIELLEKETEIDMSNIKNTFPIMDKFVRKDLVIGEINVCLAKKMDGMPLFDLNLLPLIKQFMIPDVLGPGLFKNVYKGLYRGKDVAISKYNKWMDPDRMGQEMRTLNILSNYEYTPKFYGYFSDENNDIYLVQEYCNLGSLDDVIKNNPELIAPLEVRLQILYSVLSAIHVLHIYDIPHRKVISKRILVNRDSKGNLTFKLTGFGRTNNIFTEERCFNELHHDIWGLGKLVSILLRDDYAHYSTSDDLNNLNNVREIYPQFQEFLNSCFEDTKGDKYLKCEALLDDLMKFMSISKEITEKLQKQRKIHRLKCELFLLITMIQSIKYATWHKEIRYNRMLRKLENHLIKNKNMMTRLEDILNPNFNRNELNKYLDDLWKNQLLKNYLYIKW